MSLILIFEYFSLSVSVLLIIFSTKKWVGMMIRIISFLCLSPFILWILLQKAFITEKNESLGYSAFAGAAFLILGFMWFHMLYQLVLSKKRKFLKSVWRFVYFGIYLFYTLAATVIAIRDRKGIPQMIYTDKIDPETGMVRTQWEMQHLTDPQPYKEIVDTLQPKKRRKKDRKRVVQQLLENTVTLSAFPGTLPSSNPVEFQQKRTQNLRKLKKISYQNFAKANLPHLIENCDFKVYLLDKNNDIQSLDEFRDKTIADEIPVGDNLVLYIYFKKRGYTYVRLVDLDGIPLNSPIFSSSAKTIHSMLKYIKSKYPGRQIFLLNQQNERIEIDGSETYDALLTQYADKTETLTLGLKTPHPTALDKWLHTIEDEEKYRSFLEEEEFDSDAANLYYGDRDPEIAGMQEFASYKEKLVSEPPETKYEQQPNPFLRRD